MDDTLSHSRIELLLSSSYNCKSFRCEFGSRKKEQAQIKKWTETLRLKQDLASSCLMSSCCEVTTACQHTSPLRHLRSSSRCVADFHRNVGVSGTDISLSTSGKAAPKQTNQKTKTPRSHTESTTHVMRDPKPDSFGANSSSSQAHLLQTLLAPTCYLVVPLPLC